MPTNTKQQLCIKPTGFLVTNFVQFDSFLTMRKTLGNIKIEIEKFNEYQVNYSFIMFFCVLAS